MLKKTITFEDFDGNSHTEDFYFNLSKTELYEMNVSEKGGFSDYLQQIIVEENGREIIRIMREILQKAYGVRSPDGKKFVKNEEVWNEFKDSAACDSLLFELYSDSVKAAEFFRGIAPAELVDQVEPIDSANLTPDELRKKTLEQMQQSRQPKTD